MCNLYSNTRSQEAIRAITKALRDTTGNLPSMPGIFPDYKAPIVRILRTAFANFVSPVGHRRNSQ